MNPTIAAEAMVGLFAVSVVVFLWLGPVRWVATDWARNVMFAAREDLFDAAAAGRISFDDPGYCRIREGINSMIRFAHELSLIRLVVHAQSGRRVSTPTMRNAADEIRDLGLRGLAAGVVTRVEFAALLLMFAKSPFLSMIMIIYVFGPKAIGRWTRRDSIEQSLMGRLRPYADMIQAEAAAA